MDCVSLTISLGCDERGNLVAREKVMIIMWFR